MKPISILTLPEMEWNFHRSKKIIRFPPNPNATLIISLSGFRFSVSFSVNIFWTVLCFDSLPFLSSFLRYMPFTYIEHVMWLDCWFLFLQCLQQDTCNHLPMLLSHFEAREIDLLILYLLLRSDAIQRPVSEQRKRIKKIKWIVFCFNPKGAYILSFACCEIKWNSNEKEKRNKINGIGECVMGYKTRLNKIYFIFIPNTKIILMKVLLWYRWR